MQSEKGQDILNHLKLPTDKYESMLYIEEHCVYKKSTAFLKIIQQLPFPIRILIILKYTPKYFRDFLYDKIANNRYKLFGKFDKCMLPKEEHKHRFL